VKCAYTECGQEFQAKTHNQRYCSDDCCRKATNARLMKQYYEKKARLKGHIRVCATADCGTVLSRYNNSKTCRKCEATHEQSKRNELLFNLVGI
jgi:hypothetical protein